MLAGSTTIEGELTSGSPSPAGSTLLGPTFPDLGADGEADGGFEALLLVTGDPVAVYNDYVDSAEALGMRSGQGGCISGFGSITCARRVVDPSDGEALSIMVERRPVDGRVRVARRAALRAARFGRPRRGRPDHTLAAHLHARRGRAAAGGTGRRATGGASCSRRAVRPLELAEGTMLAGPPGPCPCGTRGWSAVLRVDGSAEEAIDAYAAQLGVDDPVIRTDDDGETMVADLGLVPGGVTQLRATTDERGTWLMLSVSFG